MLFNSIVFLFIFLPMILVLYYIVPGRLKNAVLLLASLFFYAWGEPVYVFLLLFSVLFHYFGGLYIARKAEDHRAARAGLVFAVILDLVILAFFKYAGSLVQGLNAVFALNMPEPEVGIPIGLSFYTFQVLSYLVDVYRGEIKAQVNLLDFALYVTMFPKIAAGPVMKYSEISWQLKNRKSSWSQFGDGVMLFLRGLAKKVILADSIGRIYTEVTELPLGQISVLSAWLGCAAFAFQIYFDFSGYSDMAVGIGRMFGLELRQNFRYPYTSRSVTEFWRRWQISLGRWVREYVYIPLGGESKTPWKQVLSLLPVWLLVGLWHGGTGNFAVWGLYFGLLLMIEKCFLGKILEKLPGVVQHLYCMICVMIGWVLFAGSDLSSSFQYLKVMFGAGACGIADSEGRYLLMTNLGWWILLILGSTPVVHRCYEKWMGGNRRRRVIVNCVVYGALFLLCIAYLVTETSHPFFYFHI